MNASRRVALILHSLGRDDRGWLLARFAPERRKRLQTLLDELAELGIAQDPALVQELLADATVGEGDHDDAVAAVERAPAAAVVSTLSGEPAALIEWMLSLHPWPWRAEILAALSRAKREQVEALAAARLASGALGGDALRAASIRELAARVRQGVVPSAPARSRDRRPKWLRFGRAA